MHLVLPGNETVERLKQVFMSSGQNYGALALDLHGNRLGPTALFQVCFLSFKSLFFFLMKKTHEAWK